MWKGSETQRQWLYIAYKIVAPHSSHGGDTFDDCMDTLGEKLCVDESTIFVWTVGTFVVSIVVGNFLNMSVESDAVTGTYNKIKLLT